MGNQLLNYINIFRKKKLEKLKRRKKKNTLNKSKDYFKHSKNARCMIKNLYLVKLVNYVYV